MLLVFGFVSGFFLGEALTIMDVNKAAELRQQEKDGIESATSNYSPSCEQLSEEGLSGPTFVDGSYISIFVAEEKFKVIGMHFDKNGEVYFDWWGGDKHHFSICEDK